MSQPTKKTAKKKPLEQEETLSASTPLIDFFLHHLIVERGLSPNTVEAYARDVRTFADHLQATNGPAIDKVRSSDVIDFVKAQRNKGLGPRTVARRLSALRTFYKTLEREGRVSESPMERLDAPRLWKTLPRTLSREQAQALVEVSEPDTPMGMRDRGILEVLYGAGLRVSEVSDLRLSQLDLNVGFIRTMGKGSKERVVPLGARAKEALEPYLAVGRPNLVKKGKRDDHVFLNRFGGRFSRQSIWKLVKSACSRAGIPGDAGPHTLRHSFASHMLEGGADLRSLQMMLGHADLSTTQIYTHVTRGHLRRMVKKHHPRGG